MYDLTRYFYEDDFIRFRKGPSIQKGPDPDSWSYSIFLFVLLVVIEYLPIIMFLLNLKFVFNHQTPLVPKTIQIGNQVFEG